MDRHTDRQKESENGCCNCLCSFVGTAAVLYCVGLVTVKYLTNTENADHRSIRHK